MKLKQSLLYLILDNPNTPTKYSKSFLNLKNVIELEKKDNFKFTGDILNRFANLTEEYSYFINNIPLKIVETYYKNNFEKLDEYVYIEFKGKEISDLKIIDIYIELEKFFEEVFEIACDIANLYNFEIKFSNQNGKSSQEMI